MHTFAELVKNFFVFGCNGNINTLKTVSFHFLAVDANAPGTVFFNFIYQNQCTSKDLFLSIGICIAMFLSNIHNKQNLGALYLDTVVTRCQPKERCI
jgi:hypothetical protein